MSDFQSKYAFAFDDSDEDNQAAQVSQNVPAQSISSSLFEGDSMDINIPPNTKKDVDFQHSQEQQKTQIDWNNSNSYDQIQAQPSQDQVYNLSDDKQSHYCEDIQQNKLQDISEIHDANFQIQEQNIELQIQQNQENDDTSNKDYRQEVQIDALQNSQNNKKIDWFQQNNVQQEDSLHINSQVQTIFEDSDLRNQTIYDKDEGDLQNDKAINLIQEAAIVQNKEYEGHQANVQNKEEVKVKQTEINHKNIVQQPIASNKQNSKTYDWLKPKNDTNFLSKLLTEDSDSDSDSQSDNDIQQQVKKALLQKDSTLDYKIPIIKEQTSIVVQADPVIQSQSQNSNCIISSNDHQENQYILQDITLNNNDNPHQDLCEIVQNQDVPFSESSLLQQQYNYSQSIDGNYLELIELQVIETKEHLTPSNIQLKNDDYTYINQDQAFNDPSQQQAFECQEEICEDNEYMEDQIGISQDQNQNQANVSLKEINNDINNEEVNFYFQQFQSQAFEQQNDLEEIKSEDNNQVTQIPNEEIKEQKYMNECKFEDYQIPDQTEQINSYQFQDLSTSVDEQIDLIIPSFESVFDIAPINTLHFDLVEQEISQSLQGTQIQQQLNQAEKEYQQHNRKLQSHSQRIFFSFHQNQEFRIISQQKHSNTHLKVKTEQQSIYQYQAFKSLFQTLQDYRVFDFTVKERLIDSIIEYISIAKPTGYEKKSWILLQSMIQEITIESQLKLPKILSLKGGKESLQLRNQVIQFLIDSDSLIKKVQDHKILKHQTNVQEQIQTQNRKLSEQHEIRLANAFDYGQNQFNFENVEASLIQELSQRGKDSEALLMTLVFGTEQQKSQMILKLINEKFDISNPLFTFMHVKLGKIGYLFQLSDIQKVMVNNWPTHLAFILSNLDKLKDQLQFVVAFIKQLAFFLMKQKQDIWQFMFLMLILNESGLNIIKVSPQTSFHVTPSLNIFQSIKELLNYQNPQSKRNLVELAFYRSQIFSKTFTMHEQAHEDLHYVIENRDCLNPQIWKSQYFQFMLREMKQYEYFMSKRQKQKEEQLKKQLQSSAQKQKLNENTSNKATNNNGKFFKQLSISAQKTQENQKDSQQSQEEQKIYSKTEQLQQLDQLENINSSQTLSKENEENSGHKEIPILQFEESPLKQDLNLDLSRVLRNDNNHQIQSNQDVQTIQIGSSEQEQNQISQDTSVQLKSEPIIIQQKLSQQIHPQQDIKQIDKQQKARQIELQQQQQQQFQKQGIFSGFGGIFRRVIDKASDNLKRNFTANDEEESEEEDYAISQQMHKNKMDNKQSVQDIRNKGLYDPQKQDQLIQQQVEDTNQVTLSETNQGNLKQGRYKDKQEDHTIGKSEQIKQIDDNQQEISTIQEKVNSITKEAKDMILTSKLSDQLAQSEQNPLAQQIQATTTSLPQHPTIKPPAIRHIRPPPPSIPQKQLQNQSLANAQLINIASIENHQLQEANYNSAPVLPSNETQNTQINGQQMMEINSQSDQSQALSNPFGFKVKNQNLSNAGQNAKNKPRIGYASFLHHQDDKQTIQPKDMQ
eukprot:403345756